MARALRIGLLALVATVALPALLVSAPAQAAEMDKKAKADAKEAMRLYKEGNYDDAAKIFVKLSVDHPDMLVFVRNLGACYYYMRRFDPALSNLRDYLHRKKDITPDDRDEVEGWIAEIERLRAQPAGVSAPNSPAPVAATPPAEPVAATPSPAEQDQPSVAPPPPAAPPTYPMEPQPPVAQAPYAYPSAEAPQVATPAAGSSDGTRKTVAWVLGAAGATSVIVGVYCTAMALDRFSKVETKYDPGAESDGKTFAKAQWVGYGVGAALIGAAVIVGFSGGKASGVAWAPAVGPGTAGATMQGRF